MNKSNLFAAYFKEKRQEKGFTLRELADKSGVSHTYLYNIEKGHKTPPNDRVLVQLANALALNNKSRRLWFDIAAKDKQIADEKNIYLPADVLSYITEINAAKEVIRKANESGCVDDFWINLLEKL